MNLLVNSLPTRTWNRLGMNETHLSLEGEFQNHIPLAQWDPAEILWEPKTKRKSVSDAAGEFSEAIRNADMGYAETAAHVVMKTPLVLTYDYQSGERGASRLVLHAGRGSHMQVIVLLTSGEDGTASAIQTEVFAEEDARVDIYTAQLLGSHTVCLYNVTGTCRERADVRLTKLELGAGQLYAGASLDLLGQESSFHTEIAYHGQKDQVLDMNYVALHRGRNTNSLMEINGTLEEGAKKIFRGTIDFQKGCAGSKGTESENVLLLGEEMVNQTIPLILCKEEDVEGNHGASIGRLDDKVLFYLGSRGIPRQKAQQMIAQSRIDAVCAKIPDEKIRSRVREFETLRGISHESEL